MENNAMLQGLKKIDQLRIEAEKHLADFLEARNRLNETMEEISKTVEDFKIGIWQDLPSNQGIQQNNAQPEKPFSSSSYFTPAEVISNDNHNVKEMKVAFAKNAKAEALAPVNPEKRKSGQTPLNQICMEVLNNYKSYISNIPDYPENAIGLNLPEIKSIIMDNNLWISKSKDIPVMIQSTLSVLKKDGKIGRGPDRRYFVI